MNYDKIIDKIVCIYSVKVMNKQNYIDDDIIT